MTIEFQACKNDKTKLYAPTIKEAIQQFLETYKARSFTVTEYRNGAFRMILGGNFEEHTGEKPYFRHEFKSRKEAQDYLND